MTLRFSPPVIASKIQMIAQQRERIRTQVQQEKAARQEGT